MNPNLLFAHRQRYRLNGDPVHENPFAPWTVDDLFPWVEYWDLNLAGYRELPADFPLDAIVANEEAIASAPNGYEDKLFFMIHWAVRIERARRRGRP